MLRSQSSCLQDREKIYLCCLNHSVCATRYSSPSRLLYSWTFKRLLNMKERLLSYKLFPCFSVGLSRGKKRLVDFAWVSQFSQFTPAPMGLSLTSPLLAGHSPILQPKWLGEKISIKQIFLRNINSTLSIINVDQNLHRKLKIPIYFKTQY